MRVSTYSWFQSTGGGGGGEGAGDGDLYGALVDEAVYFSVLASSASCIAGDVWDPIRDIT